MRDDIDKLKRDYRDIRAPAHLATRIRAEVADRGQPRRSWLPAMATVAIAAAALTITPVLLQQRSTEETATPKPTSMSTLARVASQKPAMTAPSLTRMKSVKLPALPRKPKPDSEKTSMYKEKDHAYS